MGRHKPGKRRRERRQGANYTLRQLQPPGDGYDEWIQATPGMDLTHVGRDPRLSAESVELMQRIARLAGPYGRQVPMAAVLLDTVMDTGFLPLQKGKETVMVPLDDAARMLGTTTVETASVRESVHQLHSVGALLVQYADEEEIAVARIVAQRPQHPGEPWIFADEDIAATVPSTCIPNGAAEALSTEEFAAYAYLRSHEAQGTTASAEEFAHSTDWVTGPDHAQQLFTAVADSGWLEKKGCAACPTGHLCERNQTETPQSGT